MDEGRVSFRAPAGSVARERVCQSQLRRVPPGGFFLRVQRICELFGGPKRGSESFSIGEQPGLASARFIKIEDPHAQEASLMLRFCLGFGWGLGAGRKETAKKQKGP